MTSEQDEPQQTPDAYDAIYSTGGYQGVYLLPVESCHYYPLFAEVRRELHRLGARSVLEVGCGTGWLAELLTSDHRFSYRGFDFSPRAIEMARERNDAPNRFDVADATEATSYTGNYDAIVCTEVLEHLPDDLAVVGAWPIGVRAVCTVPNYSATNHERWFDSEGAIVERYEGLLDFERIRRVRKPVLADISTRSRLRNIVWNRTRPRMITKILGLTDFRADGGWYVFTATRRDRTV